MAKYVPGQLNKVPMWPRRWHSALGTLDGFGHFPALPLPSTSTSVHLNLGSSLRLGPVTLFRLHLYTGDWGSIEYLTIFLKFGFGTVQQLVNRCFGVEGREAMPWILLDNISNLGGVQQPSFCRKGKPACTWHGNNP